MNTDSFLSFPMLYVISDPLGYLSYKNIQFLCSVTSIKRPTAHQHCSCALSCTYLFDKRCCCAMCLCGLYAVCGRVSAWEHRQRAHLPPGVVRQLPYPPMSPVISSLTPPAWLRMWLRTAAPHNYDHPMISFKCSLTPVAFRFCYQLSSVFCEHVLHC